MLCYIVKVALKSNRAKTKFVGYTFSNLSINFVLDDFETCLVILVFHCSIMNKIQFLT